LRILTASFSLVIALVGSSIASAQPAGHWDGLLSFTFQILADRPDLPVRCTGWFAAPRGHVGSMLVSVYVTAGHCDVPHIVRIAEGFEQMARLAHVNRLGVDAAVGVRLDSRPRRTFPVLATTFPRPGDRALVAGYSAGHLTEAVLTTLPDCSYGFVCFHSDCALRPGMSGAPILSLRTGEIVGILVGTPLDAHGYGDPQTIWATPSTALRVLIDLAAPKALETDRAQRAPSGLFKAVPLHSAFPNPDLVEP
jgi:hypothetical protein